MRQHLPFQPLRYGLRIHDAIPSSSTPDPQAASAPPSPATLEPERGQLAKRYAQRRQTLSLINLGLSAALIVIALTSGANLGLRDLLASAGAWRLYPGWSPLQVGLYFLILYLGATILRLPLTYYGGFTLPHHYGLSTQSLRAWTLDLLKGQALGLVFNIFAVECIYALLAYTPTTWWLWTAILTLLFAVLLANLAPILFFPLFYKLTPLPDNEIKRRALAMAAAARTQVRGIYAMNMSSKTTAANAMVIGLGNTRRIVLGDTLLDRYTPDEIEVVVAHELGHQVHNDIPKLIAVETISTLVSLYLINITMRAIITQTPGYHGLADPATMPLIAAIAGIFALVTLPVTNGFSRFVERQADAYALQTTQNTQAFISAMTRLANQNLAELEPSPIVEFLLYDHPSIGRRLAFARKISQHH